MENSSCVELVTQLQKNLLVHSYTEYQEANLPEIGLIYQILTKRSLNVRYICVLNEVPASVENDIQCKKNFEFIRDYLTKKYAIMPWGKELGTFAILLCSHELYSKLEKTMNKFRDLSGYHRNTMLGSVIVDKGSYKYAAIETWGLWYAGKHFSTIKKVIHNWCEQSQ